MLGNEERDAALPHALRVLWHHVVAHDLDVPAVLSQEIVADEMSLRVERNAMVHMRMGLKELVKNLVERLLRLSQWEVHLCNLNLWEVIPHVMPEASLTVRLLLGADVSVLELLHHHDFLLLRRDEHHHAGGEVATLEGVLTEERQRLQVGQVGVEQNEGHAALGQLIGKVTCHLQLCRHNNDAINLLCQTIGSGLDERRGVETLVVEYAQRDVEVATVLCGGLHALFYLVPVGLAVVLGDDADEGVVLVVGQRRGVHIGLIVHL